MLRHLLKLSLFIFCVAASVSAATFTVTKTADTNDGVCDADCSLREAVAAAIAAGTDDDINFDAGVFAGAQTITLTLGQLFIANNGSLTINGTGANLLTISGSNASRVFSIATGANATIGGVRITGGNWSGNGGGISNSGTLNLTNSTVSGNLASNGGGGINNFGGTMNVTNSTVSGNSASSNGGGIINFGTMNVTNSTVSGNTASGGGGIYNDGGTMNVTNSTVSGNLASGGGGINNFGTLNVTNSTVSGNAVSGNGGGIINFATMNVTNSTVSGNSAFNGGGGGISNSGGTFRARNTITSGNTANINPDLQGILAVNENNLIGGNALLAPLGSYGGTTQTHALLSGSSAINAGNNCVLTQSCTTFNAPVGLTADQRGAARVGQVDIGAFEVNNSANGGGFRASLPSARQGVNYNFVITPNNGAATYQVTGGNLPSGVSLTTAFAPSAVVSLGGVPTQSGTFDFSITTTSGGNTTITDYRLNVIPTTSANASISGRVFTDDRNALRNAAVLLTDGNGNTRTAKTGSFGIYRFDELEIGQTYIVQIVSKKFTFAPQTVFLTDNLTDLNFTAQ